MKCAIKAYAKDIEEQAKSTGNLALLEVGRRPLSVSGTARGEVLHRT
jgi:hypothetical protein